MGVFSSGAILAGILTMGSSFTVMLLCYCAGGTVGGGFVAVLITGFGLKDISLAKNLDSSAIVL